MTASTLEPIGSEQVPSLEPVSPSAPTSGEIAALGNVEHLALLDGLRAYLAAWVLVCHAMWVSGYECDKLDGVCALVCRGAHAVDVFVVLSGFVIFKLLDAGRETYGVFIARRFLRLFPAYILLFLVAIPASKLAEQDLTLGSRYFTPAHLAEVATQFSDWFDNLGWHTMLHLSLMHGLVPRALLSEAPGAFLEPAWSISLEWQFYLVAPFAYAAAVSQSLVRRCAVILGALLLFVLAAGGVLPAVDFGAALPFHSEYFFLGAASYFLYKRNLQAPISESPALTLFVTSAFVFQLGHRNPGLIPFCIWALILGLVLERPDTPWSRAITKPLVHPIARYVGRISYSLYLSHMIVLYVLQHLLLQVAPNLSRTVHCVCLIVLTFGVSLPASAFLFRYVESPGIRLGRQFAKRRQSEVRRNAFHTALS